MLPTRGANQGENRREAAAPAREVCLEAQQQIAAQGTPDLPADGIGAMSEKAGELEGLLDLFEEHFDIPAQTVEVGYAARVPVHIVGEEFHFALEPHLVLGGRLPSPVLCLVH